MNSLTDRLRIERDEARELAVLRPDAADDLLIFAELMEESAARIEAQEHRICSLESPHCPLPAGRTPSPPEHC